MGSCREKRESDPRRRVKRPGAGGERATVGGLDPCGARGYANRVLGGSRVTLAVPKNSFEGPKDALVKRSIRAITV